MDAQNDSPGHRRHKVTCPSGVSHVRVGRAEPEPIRSIHSVERHTRGDLRARLGKGVRAPTHAFPSLAFLK